ncbi:MAG: radical SAM protein [Elusimicrobia bacterium]|nr:radical SAM protein [Elusimicrobiota bacterium]
MRKHSRRAIAAWVKDRLVHGLLSFTGSQKFLTAQLDITNSCNLRCAHCYHRDHSNDGGLDLAGWRTVLDQYGRLADKLCLEPWFVICGGEPTISPLFLPILDEIEARWPGVRITVLTNGTRLSAELAMALRRFNVGFQVSLDGPDAARHDLVRGPGSFERALTGLRNLQAAGLNATFQATLSRRSSAWIADFFETADNCGASQMNFTRFILQGNGSKLQEGDVDRPLSGPELRNAYREILRCSKSSGVSTSTDLPLMSLVDPSLGAHGKAGFQGVIIDHKGNLKVSSRSEYVLGNILAAGLEPLFLGHPIMKALRDRRIEGCGDCAHYARCGGDRNASFAATGSFFKKDPACWLEAVQTEVAQ